jgi:hypothetical protein
LSGDEFAVVATNPDPDVSPAIIAEKIIRVKVDML